MLLSRSRSTFQQGSRAAPPRCATRSTPRSRGGRQTSTGCSRRITCRGWIVIDKTAVLFAIVSSLAVVGCKREDREFREIPPASTTLAVAVSDLHPGGGNPPAPAKTPYELNA